MASGPVSANVARKEIAEEHSKSDHARLRGIREMPPMEPVAAIVVA